MANDCTAEESVYLVKACDDILGELGLVHKADGRHALAIGCVDWPNHLDARLFTQVAQ
jgi:hypothetical protein